MSLRLITPPDSDPVSLDEAKAFLGITNNTNDAVISALISAATIQCQGLVQRAFVSQVQEWVITDWCPVLRLPIAPVAPSGIASIKYVDLSEAQQTLDPSQYVAWQAGKTVAIQPVLGTVWPFISIKPAPEPIVIRFTVGDAVADVPENVKTAIKFAVRSLYTMNTNSLLSLERVEGVLERRYTVSKEVATVIDGVVASLLADQQWD